jgi:hypothetical protein
MKTKRIAIVALLLAGGVVVAQDATFTATVSPASVGVGDRFQVSFTFSGTEANVSGFRPPDLSQFVVLGGPSQSTSMQFINGRSSASVSYTYVLSSRQQGKFTIGAASVEYRGSTLRSNPVTVDIVEGKPRQTPEQEAGSENVFVRVTADKQRVRRGEQLTLTYKLYTLVQVSTYNISKSPQYEGFWVEEIEQSSSPTLGLETYEGKQYRVATIRRSALFPTRTGLLRIEPMEVKCAVHLPGQRSSNDPFSLFNDPFFQRLRPIEMELRTNALTITVDSLPAGAPAHFEGAVGKFTLTASVDKQEVKAGDPVTLKVTVSGSGNVKLLTLPQPQLPADLESYEPKVSENISREGGVVRGRKSADYLLIPRNAGRRVIEPMKFTYFDLEKQSYMTLTSPRFEITVTPGRELAGGAAMASKTDVQLLGDDIRFIKLSAGEFRPLQSSPFAGTGIYLGIAAPPALFLGALVYRRSIERSRRNRGSERARRAAREAAKRLKLAKKLLAAGNAESYHAEISNALMGYLESKLHRSRSTLTLEDALAELQRRGVGADATGQLQSCVERAEYARFAPGADTREARLDAYESAAAAIERIEESLNGKG